MSKSKIEELLERIAKRGAQVNGSKITDEDVQQATSGYFLSSVNPTGSHLQTLQDKLGEIAARKPSTFEGIAAFGKAIPRISLTGNQIFIPDSVLSFVDGTQTQEILSLLQEFEREETVLKSKLEIFQALTGKSDASYAIASIGKTTTNVIQLPLDSKIRLLLDPIYNFAATLNKALGANVFTQETSKEGVTTIIINPSNVDALQSKEKILQDAIANPRGFIREQKMESGFLGKFQATFDSFVQRTWLQNTGQEAVEESRQLLKGVRKLVGQKIPLNFTTANLLVDNERKALEVIQFEISHTTELGNKADPIHQFTKVLHEALGAEFFTQHTSFYGEKGQTILRITPEKFEALKEICSDETKSNLLRKAFANPRAFASENLKPELASDTKPDSPQVPDGAPEVEPAEVASWRAKFVRSQEPYVAVGNQTDVTELQKDFLYRIREKFGQARWDPASLGLDFNTQPAR